MPLALRLALRDLCGGVAGFGVFIACIAIGVTAIVGVGSLSRSLADGLARQGRVILGGDASLDLVQRAASPAEMAFLASKGRWAEVDLLRAMARGDKGDSALVEIKAVGPGYPVTGAVTLDPSRPLSDALGSVDGRFGIVADATLGARLGLKVGDVLRIGSQRFQLRALLVGEPDRLAAGIGIGPRVLMTRTALDATGLVQPGSLLRRLYRVTLPDAAPGQPATSAALHDFVAQANKQFPQAGWEVRTRENVSPQFSRDLDRFTQFLTLVGLTSLIVGGAGVANAVSAFVQRKRATVATLKALGATGGYAFGQMLGEVALIAAIGVAIGCLFGVAVPFAVAAAFRGTLPFPLAPSVYPTEIATGALYGLWIALAFSVAPLGRAHDTPVSVLFRSQVEPGSDPLRPRYRITAILAGLGLATVILALSHQRSLTFGYMAATAGGFVILRVLAAALMVGLRRLPPSRSVAVRLALGNIHRPSALTPTIVLSLGLGLALLVTLSLIDGNIRAQLKQPSVGETPSFYFLDVQSAQAPDFRNYLQARAPTGKLEFVPMMRGRIVAVNGTPAEKVKAGDKAAWVLQGDRGITFAPAVPIGSKLVKGQWWPIDYTGRPLVSLESDIADGLGLAIGDSIAVNVFGRVITATVSNTRKVDWRKFGINFVLVFSPNTFAGAPYSDLATITFAQTDNVRELGLLHDVANDFPAITTIRVRDALDAVAGVVAQLATAIRGAAAIALVSSVLVLAGALASGQEARLYDSVVLKTLGATRGRLIGAMLLEYAILGSATAVIGVLAGTAAAYGVVAKVMTLDFTFFWRQAIAAAFGALVATVVLGLLGTWRVLGRKPAAYLRNL